MAAELGFEPRHTESESAVLPLHNSAKIRLRFLMLVYSITQKTICQVFFASFSVKFIAFCKRRRFLGRLGAGFYLKTAKYLKIYKCGAIMKRKTLFSFFAERSFFRCGLSRKGALISFFNTEGRIL